MTGQPKLAPLFSSLVRSVGGALSGRTQPTSFVRVEGQQFVAPNGQPLFLKGINLGNWLVPEGYMFKFETANSPRLIRTVINQLIGEEASKKFWRDHWDHYITQADIQLIKRLGFNSVRVPFHSRLFMTESNPPQLAGVGYELLDRLIRWCREEHLYVVLEGTPVYPIGVLRVTRVCWTAPMRLWVYALPDTLAVALPCLGMPAVKRLYFIHRPVSRSS